MPDNEELRRMLVAGVEGQMAQLGDQIMTHQEEKRRLEVELRELSQCQEPNIPANQFLEELFEIAELPGVHYVTVSGDVLLAHCEVRVRYSGKIYDFGDYVVTIGDGADSDDDGEDSDWFFARRVRSGLIHIDNVQYPNYYFGSSYGFCFGGELEKLIKKHIQQNEFSRAMRMIVSALHAVNNHKERSRIPQTFREAHAPFSKRHETAHINDSEFEAYVSWRNSLFKERVQSPLERAEESLQTIEAHLADLKESFQESQQFLASLRGLSEIPEWCNDQKILEPILAHIDVSGLIYLIQNVPLIEIMRAEDADRSKGTLQVGVTIDGRGAQKHLLGKYLIYFNGDRFKICVQDVSDSACASVANVIRGTRDLAGLYSFRQSWGRSVTNEEPYWKILPEIIDDIRHLQNYNPDLITQLPLYTTGSQRGEESE